MSFSECVFVHLLALVHRAAIHRADEAKSQLFKWPRPKPRLWEGKLPGFTIPKGYQAEAAFEALIIALPFWLAWGGAPLNRGGGLVVTAMSISMVLDSFLPRTMLSPGPGGFDHGVVFYAGRALLARGVVAAKVAFVGLVSALLLDVPGLGDFFRSTFLGIAPILELGICQVIDECRGRSLGLIEVFTMIIFISCMRNALFAARSGLHWSMIYVITGLYILITCSYLLDKYGGDITSQTYAMLALGWFMVVPTVSDFFVWMHRDP